MPQNDLQARYMALRDRIDPAIARVASSGFYVLGPEVERFERRFAHYLGATFGIGVGSGTDAVEVALRACGIGAGDVVLTVGHSAVGTVVGIERTGARVALVDVDRETYTMCPESLRDAIRSHTGRSRERFSAIVPVHLYGQPADMVSIEAIASEHGLVIVEDCAQAHGASLQNRRVGTWGSAGAFSFYPTKNLGALGDAGMVVTSDPKVARRAREIRQYGWQQRHISLSLGINSRLDELQAAILDACLDTLDDDNQKRRFIAQTYDTALSATQLALPKVRDGRHHVYHQYVVRSRRRDALREFLQRRGVASAVHYPVPIHRQPAYAGRLFHDDQLVTTEQLAQQIVSLPMYPQMPDEHIDMVIRTLLEWHRQATR